MARMEKLQVSCTVPCCCLTKCMLQRLPLYGFCLPLARKPSRHWLEMQIAWVLGGTHRKQAQTRHRHDRWEVI